MKLPSEHFNAMLVFIRFQFRVKSVLKSSQSVEILSTLPLAEAVPLGSINDLDCILNGRRDSIHGAEQQFLATSEVEITP
jgi:hypothetical protein